MTQGESTKKTLKKRLSKLKHFKANLPRLIDCSEIYGDNYYSKDDLLDVEKQIEDLNVELLIKIKPKP